MAEPLCFGQISLAASERLLRPLPLCQVERETDTLLCGVIKARIVDEHGHAGAVLANVILLIGRDSPRPFQSGELFGDALAPFWRRYLDPAQATRDKIVAIVSHDAEKFVVSVENWALGVPEIDADDVGLGELLDFCLTLPETLLRLLALGDVAHQGQVPMTSALLELGGTDLHREDSAILAPVAGLEGQRLAGRDALPQPLNGRLVQTDVENTRVHADQFFPAVAQTDAGLLVDIENGQLIVVQKKRVRRVIDESAEARLAHTQRFLRLPQLRDVLKDAELTRRLSRLVPRHVALAVDYSLGAIGADHPVFDIITWTARQQGSDGRLGCSRPVLGVNQV